MAYCGSCQMSPCECNDNILTLPTGASGLPGPQGVQGAQGLQGIQGIAGANGAPGPTTCRKLSVQFTGVPGGIVTVVTATTLLNVGMLSNVYQIDPNGNITSNAIAQVNDFVWQVWRADGTGGWIDAEVEGTLTSLNVSNAGNIRVVVSTSATYKIIVIG